MPCDSTSWDGVTSMAWYPQYGRLIGDSFLQTDYSRECSITNWKCLSACMAWCGIIQSGFVHPPSCHPFRLVVGDSEDGPVPGRYPVTELRESINRQDPWQLQGWLGGWYRTWNRVVSIARV